MGAGTRTSQLRAPLIRWFIFVCLLRLRAAGGESLEEIGYIKR